MNSLSLAPQTGRIIEAISRLECIKPFVLVGGTALSIQLKTRQSEDLDFMRWKESKDDTLEVGWPQLQKELATVGVLVTEYSETEEIFYSYFDDIDKAYAAYPAYGNENAVCFDAEAQQKYDNDFLLATSKTNELTDAQWEIVDLHDL